MPAKKATLATIKRELKKMDNGHEPSDASIILMSAAMVGARPVALQKFTGFPRSKVGKYLARGRANNLFTKDGRVQVDWADGGKDSGVSFWCDVAVLEGWLAKVPA